MDRKLCIVACFNIALETAAGIGAVFAAGERSGWCWVIFLLAFLNERAVLMLRRAYRREVDDIVAVWNEDEYRAWGPK